MAKERWVLMVLIIVAAAFARLLPHPANVTPVAAIALFAGAFLPRMSFALLIPLAAMLVSDLIIGFHATLLFVYAGMVTTVAIGRLFVGSKARVLSVAAASLMASVLFFVMTNFGVWLTQDIYPHTAEGLLACFIAAIPFFTHSLLGDLAFSALLFGVFTLVEQRFPKLGHDVAA